MGCGGYHDHAGGGWLFCVCIGPARMAGLVCLRTCTLPLPTFLAYLGAVTGVWLILVVQNQNQNVHLFDPHTIYIIAILT